MQGNHMQVLKSPRHDRYQAEGTAALFRRLLVGRDRSESYDSLELLLGIAYCVRDARRDVMIGCHIGRAMRLIDIGAYHRIASRVHTK